MPNIFNYLNYHQFLDDYFHEKKRHDSSFTYMAFAEKAGLKSKGFIQEILSGKKNLTSDTITKINKELKLKGIQLEYFKDLVSFGKARSNQKKDAIFHKLLEYKKSSPAKIILHDQYEFYNQWYHNTIRELVTLYDFNEDYEDLGKNLHPPISAFQAYKSVQLLLKLKLIEKKESGYVQTHPSISTGNEVLSLAVNQFHHQNLNLMSQALDNTSPNDRDISVMILGLSPEGFAKAKTKLQAFRKELADIALNDKESNRVYHFSFQVAPTTKSLAIKTNNTGLKPSI